MAVALVALFILGGCSGPGIPQGSVLKAEYQGVYKDETSGGNIIVRVYDAADGSRPVSGEFHRLSGDARGNFSGQMKGSQMEARMDVTLGVLSGTVTGEMSADGQTMHGTFRFDNKEGSPGSWEAKKK